MTIAMDRINAEVISVKPDKVKISVERIEDFKVAEEDLKVGSYLQIADNEDVILIAIIESFSIDLIEVKKATRQADHILSWIENILLKQVHWES